MKRIGISLRVEEMKNYKERRDCIDQQWGELLNYLGYLPLFIPNSIQLNLVLLKAYEPDGFILTGGNDLAFLPEVKNIAPERDFTEKVIMGYAAENQLPLLGVCRGMQMMNVYFGGSLIPLQGHVSNRHRVSIMPNKGITATYNEVNSYHNWGISVESLSEELKVEALADDNTVESVRHKVLPWLGFMWHPERENPFKVEDIVLMQSIFEGKNK